MVPFWGALLGFLGKAATAVKTGAAAAAEGAATVAEGAAEGAATAVGSMTESAAAAPLDQAQAAMTAVPKPDAAPVTAANSPAVEAMLKPKDKRTPGEVMETITGPQMSTVPPPASTVDLTANMSTPSGPAYAPPPSTVPTTTTTTTEDSNPLKDAMGALKRMWDSKIMTELRETYGEYRELEDRFGAPAPQMNTVAPPLPQEVPISPAPEMRVPQLNRAATADLRLASDEPQLSTDQMRQMQRSGIDDFVAQLRSQRRLFG